MIHHYEPIAPLQPFIESFLAVAHNFSNYSEQTFSARGVPMLAFPFKQPSSTSFRHSHESIGFTTKMLDTPSLLFSNSTHGICHFEGAVNFIMVMLRPTGAYHFTQGSVGNSANTRISLFDVNALFFKEVQERLWNINNPEDAVHCLQFNLHRYLSQKASIGSGDFSPVVAYILRQNGLVTVAQMANKFRCSERWIEKQCLAQTGLTPKTWLRLIRYRAALNYRLSHPHSSWMELIAKYNYTDQSHLIREFKAFSGNAPTWHIEKETHTELNFRQHQAGLSGLIKP